MALVAGTRLGPYEIADALGAGGMGEVYRARDTRLDRTVAVKVLSTRLADRPDLHKRFEREARAISQLNHPNICTLHDVGCDSGTDYLVMEYLEGETLSHRLQRGPLAPELTLKYGIEIAAALETAHRQGIIHRDLKPGNIMLTKAGAKLMDFGLAKLAEQPAPVAVALSEMADAPTLPSQEKSLTEEGVMVGTFQYMSPEQAQGLTVDTRSDIFSFGLVLYEMLSGKRAFAGDTPLATLAAIVRDEPAAFAAPRALESIVRRCLAKQAAQRFQTMAEVRTALEQAGQAGNASQSQSSIAVLPFANMSADKENEYFGDGLAEEIINVLANVSGVKVAARTSSFFFREKEVEVGEIGKRLNVEHILEGSVRRAGNRIRVTAQLIKVADGFHLWSERYDRELTDIFTIQDEITQAIASALRVKLSPDYTPLRRHVPNLRAYQEYLKATRNLWDARPESLAHVKESLERAIELDPEFALPYSFLGITYTLQANLGLRPVQEILTLARAAEQRALRVDPLLPEAHAILGVCADMDYEWKEAEREWRLAMAHEPIPRDVRFWYGNHHLVPIGRFAEAVEEMAAGLEGDPLNLLYRHHYAAGLRHLDRLKDAEIELRNILEIDANFPLALGTLGAVCAQQGQFEEALALTERAYALTPGMHPIIGQLAALVARSGATNRADQLMERLQPRNTFGCAAGLVVFHAMCGELDQAAKWAGQAIDERYPQFVRIAGPLLRHTPRWPALTKRMNLPE
jgi:eukaryotic-like serine/threonine-protein kinase